MGKHGFFPECFRLFLRVTLNLTPVNGIPRSRDESPAAYSDSSSWRELSVFLIPAGFFPHLFESCLELAAANIQIIAGPGIWVHGIPEPYFYGIDPDVTGNHAQQTLKGKPRLGRAMTPHGSTGRLIRHYPITFISVIGNVVKGGDHAAGVIGCNHSKRRIRSSIKVDAGFNSRNFPIFFHTNLELHVLFVSSPPEQKHLFSSVDHLHRPSCLL